MIINSIQVIGSGCATCKQLFETTKNVVKRNDIKTEVEYITDVSKLIEMGVMTSPVLAVNGKPILTGGGKNEEEIYKALQGVSKENSETSGNCSCNGKC